MGERRGGREGERGGERKRKGGGKKSKECVNVKMK